MQKDTKAVPVIIVGAGPSGLATAGCLSRLAIPYVLLEREDCYASIWKKYAYDRLHLHLQKQFCELPHMKFPASCPTYVPKHLFIQYIDDYVSHFKISPLYRRNVTSASFDEVSKKWVVKATNGGGDGELEEYIGSFLVVATGEASNPFIPEVEGLNTFTGNVIHSTQFKSGKEFKDKRVLVVGCGNSGMEISLDLANHGAKTSILIRSPIHVISRRMAHLALVLLKHIPLSMVDNLLVILSKLLYGDLSKYGIDRPAEGPFYMKVMYGKYPTIDVGTYNKIQSGEVQVLPTSISKVRGSAVELVNGKTYEFDTILFCTGFKRSTNLWLKDDYLLKDDGIPKASYPDHWKGKNGLYCVGLSRRGLYGASEDAQKIAEDIKPFV